MHSHSIETMNDEVAEIDMFDVLFEEEIANLPDEVFAESLAIMVGVDQTDSFVSDEAIRKCCSRTYHPDDMGIYVKQAFGMCDNFVYGIRNKRKRLALPSWRRNRRTKKLGGHT